MKRGIFTIYSHNANYELKRIKLAAAMKISEI